MNVVGLLMTLTKSRVNEGLQKEVLRGAFKKRTLWVQRNRRDTTVLEERLVRYWRRERLLRYWTTETTEVFEDRYYWGIGGQILLRYWRRDYWGIGGERRLRYSRTRLPRYWRRETTAVLEDRDYWGIGGQRLLKFWRRDYCGIGGFDSCRNGTCTIHH